LFDYNSKDQLPVKATKTKVDDDLKTRNQILSI